LAEVNQQYDKKVIEITRQRDVIELQQTQLDQHRTTTDQYMQTSTKLHQRINELTSSQIDKATLSQTATQTSSPRKIFEDPERFSGNQADITQRQRAYKKWCLQIKTAYTTQPDYFPTERSKLVFAISFLSGKAYDSTSIGLQGIIEHPDDSQAWE